jgi:hypothetical protein
VFESAMRTANKIPEDITEMPLTYPKSMRKECIVILDIELKTGLNSTLVIPFKGGEGEPVEFIDEEISFSQDSVVSSGMVEIIMKCYKGTIDPCSPLYFKK